MSIESPNFTQIPNVVFDYWIPKLKPASALVLMIMCRKIFGWHKTSDHISKNQLCKASGLSKNTVQLAIEELEQNDLILKIKLTNEYGCQPNTYSLNIKKPIDQLYSEDGQKNGGGRSNSDQGVGQISTGGVGQILTPQKKDYTKERLTKEKEREEQAPLPTPISSSSKKKEPMKHYGSHVKLTETQFKELQAKYGEAKLATMIVYLNVYKSAHKTRYTSDFSILQEDQWVNKKYLEETSGEKKSYSSIPNIGKNELIADEIYEKHQSRGDITLGRSYIEFDNGMTVAHIKFDEKDFEQKCQQELKRRKLI